MKPLFKVLNLYAGIGGNRKLWKDCEVTAVENNPEIAAEYQKNFPDDTVIVGDAEKYLIEHFQEFDFIWASPPCPTHSRMRTLWKADGKHVKGKVSGSSFKLPDMRLYGIIIFLQHFCTVNWVVENVISYYNPLIKPKMIDNHYFWSNKILLPLKKKTRNILSQNLKAKAKSLGMPFPDVPGPERFRRRMLNNCVRPETGLHVWNCIFKTKQKVLV